MGGFSAVSDPLANVGTPVGHVAQAPPVDPLAGVGTPVSSSDTSAAAQPVADIPSDTPPDTNKSVWQQVADHFGGPDNDPVWNLNKGFAKGAIHTAAGALHLIDNIDPVSAADREATSGHDYVQQAADFLKDKSQTHGLFQWLGDAGENVAELLGSDGLSELGGGAKLAEGAEAAKAAPTIAERLRNSQQIATFLEKNPRVAKLAALGLHTATAAFKNAMQAGVQTGIKTGGDPNATATAAAEGGAIGGVLHAGLGAIGLAREAYTSKAAEAAKTLTEYQSKLNEYRQALTDRLTKGDEQMSAWQKAKEQLATAHAAAMKAYSSALSDHASELENARAEWRGKLADQQQANNDAMTAYQADAAKVQDANKQARQAWKAQLDEQAKQHAAEVAQYQTKLADHNQTVNALKNEATTALKTSRQMDAQRGIVSTAKNAAEDAITRFNDAMSGSRNFKAVNPVEASATVRSFGDTADTIREAAKPVYNAIDEATQGKFGELQAARSKALRANDVTEAEKVEGKIDQMLTKNPGVTPEEWRAAKSAWSDSKDLDRIHAAVEGAFNGISEEMAAQPGTSARELRGSNLQNRIGSLFRGSKPLTESRVSQLIGSDGLTGLYRAAHMTSTPELRSATKELADKVAAELQAHAPAEPVKPQPIAPPSPLPKPAKPVAPEPIPAPEAPPKPTRPVPPEMPPKPAPLPRPSPPVKPATAKATPARSFAAAVNNHLGEAVVGSAVAHATGVPYAYAIGGTVAARYVLRQMITNPRIGQMAEYAVEHGATSQNTAKIIAAMITKQEEGQEQTQ